LGFEYAVLGKWEQSAEEFRTAKELDPSQALPYAGLISAQMALGRLTDARAVYEEVRAHKLDFGELLRIRYRLAFVQRDDATMVQTLDSLGSLPGFERIALAEQAGYSRLLWPPWQGSGGVSQDARRSYAGARLGKARGN